MSTLVYNPSSYWSFQYGQAQVIVYCFLEWESNTQICYSIHTHAYLRQAYQYGIAVYADIGWEGHGTTRTRGEGANWNNWSEAPLCTTANARVFDKQAVPTTAYLWGLAQGETVGGLGPYSGGQAFTYNFSVPALPLLGSVTAPTVTGTGMTRSVVVPAVTNAASYRLRGSSPALGANYDFGAVSAGANTITIPNANDEVTFWLVVTGIVADTKTSPSSGVHLSTPSNPSTLSASASGSTVTLAWANNARRAASVKIERSTSADFSSSVTTVYNGAAKVAHEETVIGGPFYYRVSVTTEANGSSVLTGGGLTTGFTNIASATTLTAPAEVAGVSRRAPFDLNIFSLAWTNNATELAPYNNIVLETSDSLEGTYTEIATLSGTSTSTSFTSAATTEHYFRIKAVNAAGSSDYVTVGPLYGKAPAPFVVSNGALENVVSAVIGYDYSPFDSFTCSLETEVNTSEDGVVWTGWATSTAIAGEGDTVELAEITDATTFVKFRARILVSGAFEGGTREGDWVETAVVSSSFEPSLPALSYNSDTFELTIDVPQQPIGDSLRAMKLFVNGALFMDWDINGEAVSIMLQDFAPASKFTLTATMETAFYPTALETDALEVSFDGCLLVLNGVNYLAALVDDSGVRQAAIALI